MGPTSNRVILPSILIGSLPFFFFKVLPGEHRQFPYWNSEVQRTTAASVTKRSSFSGDHISLEKNRLRWHVTTPKSKDHLGGWCTYPLGNGRFLWFGMSVAREIGLRELKAETIVRSYVPSRDSKRRSDVLIQTRDDAEFPCISLHPEARMRFQEGFLHFVFIVGPPGFPLYLSNELAHVFPLPQFLLEPLPNVLFPLPISSHKLSLGSVVDIQITAMWLPGTLRELFCFTGPTS
jgi:hypothetical protein